jgi:hypothetical protein
MIGKWRGFVSRPSKSSLFFLCLLYQFIVLIREPSREAKKGTRFLHRQAR